MRGWRQILLLSLLQGLVSCSDPSDGDSPSAAVADPNSYSAAKLQALAAFESEQRVRDEKTWGKEWESRRYERVINDLWDQLNASDAPLALLGRLPFESVRFGTLSEGEVLEHAIRKRDLSGEERELRFAEWQAQLGQWNDAGWQLDYQSCRQSRFESEPAKPVRSEFDLNAHLFHPASERRVILSGTLAVTWRPSHVGRPPEWESLRLVDATWIERFGPPVFQEVVNREIMPHTGTRFIDPVIVADFDDNGRSDILFSGCNVLYSGIEGGGLRSGTFVQGSKPVVYTSVYADVTGDSVADYVIVDRRGVSTFPGGQGWRDLMASWRPAEPMKNPYALSAGDIDGDGDIDLWLAQYKMPYITGQMPTPFFAANDGFPWYLLLNDGQGRFEDVTQERGLGAKRMRRTYSGSFFDLDGDQDLDLVTVSDFAGVDWFRNDGRGYFEDISDSIEGSNLGFGMAHAVADFNNDDTLDFLMIGMNSSVADRLDGLGLWPEDNPWDPSKRSEVAFGNRLYFGQEGRFGERPLGQDLARAGWAWGVGAFDFDNDGDQDVFIANGHKTRASTRDYEEQFWAHDVFVANSDPDPMMDLHFRKVGTELYGAGYSYGGHQRNAFFLNVGGRSFVEVGFLVGLADDDDGRNVICEDFDLDGLIDVVVTSSQVWPQGRQSFRLYQNLLEGGEHWIGFRLPHGPEGREWLGAEIEISYGDEVQRQVVLAGDGYRTQRSGRVHFGLDLAVDAVRVGVRFPGGERREWAGFSPGRYHVLGE